MAYEVEAVYKDAFTDGWYQNASQTASKLLPIIDQTTIAGDDQFVDVISPVDVADGTKNRALTTDTTWTEVPMVQRKFDWVPLEIATPLSAEQVTRMMKDPTSRISTIHTQGMGRKFDKNVIAAFTKTYVDRDKDGTETSVGLPAGQTIVHGSVGFTIEKHLEAINLFDEGDVMEGNKWGVISPADKWYLGQTVDTASKDYEMIMRFVTGQTDELMGVKMLTIANGKDHSLPSTGTPLIRSLFYFDASGMTATVRNPRTLVQERPDKAGEVVQIKTLADIGVCRLEEAKVIEIEVDTTHTPA